MTQRNRRIVIIAIITLILTAIGVHYFRLYKAMGAKWGKMPPPLVDTITVKLQPWYNQITATGTLTAQQGTLLKAETAGRITHIYFHSGQTIQAGAPLIDIDPGIIQGNLNAAIAQANLTTGDYQRAIALYHRGALSKQDLDTALANKQANLAKVAALKAQLAQNAVHAPFSGQLGLCLVNEGDYVNAGQALVNLQSLDKLRTDFSVPEQYSHQIKIGDNLQLQSSATNTQLFKGQVSAIDSAIDPNTRTLAVRAFINNSQHLLLPGNFVQVTLFVGKSQSLPTIPQTALVYETNNSYVYKIIKNHAIKTDVIIAQQNDHQVAIASGLQAGDSVITAGQLKVRDNMPVRVN